VAAVWAPSTVVWATDGLVVSPGIDEGVGHEEEWEKKR
jgi:hypothetical protein